MPAGPIFAKFTVLENPAAIVRVLLVAVPRVPLSVADTNGSVVGLMALLSITFSFWL
jgi:hypothetical protein